ncbi:MAG: RagB/SusD family nutrient uptake outer membrane protein [Tannerellaceae bacterium]|nr:RagB/SusD family nutrient uptake outer membrane protein [Tannerellaceae bacterium]
MVVFAFTGCEDFLDSENLVQKNTSNYPKNAKEIEELLTGIYSVLPSVHAQQSTFFVSELMSDDRLGGGAAVDRSWAALDNLKKINDNMLNLLWQKMYYGIYRANLLLEVIDDITDFGSENQKNTIKAEAHFLRAYFYFELARSFGAVPLSIDTKDENLPRAAVEEVYGQIAADFKYAIETLPNETFQQSVDRSGHATKWAAQGMMARVYLFYTGYYKKESLPLTGGSEITSQQVINWLDDCIKNSGHGLLPSFASLWPYGNKATAPDYKYAADNGIEWIGEEGANYETVFAIKYSAMADFGTSIYYSNQPVLYFSIREQPNGYLDIFPFGQGWGGGPVATNMINDWKTLEPNDPRREASVLDVENPAEGLTNYVWGASMQIQETGLWQKKYTAINAYDTDANGNTMAVNYSVKLYGRTSSYQIDNTQDQFVIRFADILLMMAELKKDHTYIDQVRSRIGLPSVGSYTEDALRNERRWELAFEGVRYYDLMRWGIAGEALNKQNGVQVKNNGVDAVMNYGDLNARYQSTGGFLPIPQTQIDLSGGVLTQTPGWGSDAIY